MPNSTVSQLKRTIKEIDPPFFTDRKGDGRDQYMTTYQNATQPQAKLGKFLPAYLPGDSYVDQEKRKNIERVMESHKNFSHRAFVMGNRPLEHEHHGGWEGTFAAMHGGYPHMFENLAPNKTRLWRGDKSTKPVQPMPMLVRYPNKGNSGFPNRALGEEYPYHSEMNHDTVEKMNQRLKLGLGGGFRGGGSRDGKGQGSRGPLVPWMTTGVHPRVFNAPPSLRNTDGGGGGGGGDGAGDGTGAGGTGGEGMVGSWSKAATLAARAQHNAPFISSAPERKLPADLFGRYGYMEEEYIDNVHKRFDETAQEEIKARDRRLGLKSVHHPPFKSAGPSILSRPSPSVMFRRSGR